MLVSTHLPYTKKNTKDSYDTNQLPISDSEKVGTMSGQFKISKICTSRSVQSDHRGSSMTHIQIMRMALPRTNK